MINKDIPQQLGLEMEKTPKLEADKYKPKRAVSIKKMLHKLASRLSTIYKVAAMLVTIVLILLLFPKAQTQLRYDYAVGSIWSDSDLYAPFDFAVQRSQSEREKEFAEARSKSLLYYTEDSSASSAAQHRLASYAIRHNLSRTECRSLAKSIDSIYRIGYIEEPTNFPDIDLHTLVLLRGNTGSEFRVSDFVRNKDIPNVVLTDSILIPSIRFDNVRTQLELDSWLSRAKTATEMVQRGQLIVSKGEPVSAETAEVIASLESERNGRMKSQYNPVGHYAGLFFLCLIALVSLYMFLKITRHKILEENKKITFVLFVILLQVAVTALVLHVDDNWILIVPLCIAPIIMRVFFDMRVALYIQLATIIIIGNMVPNPFEFIFYQLITAMMSIITVRNFEKRSNFFVVSFVIFLTYSLIYTCGVLSQFTNFDTINPMRYLIFFLNALLTLLAYPLIFVFERLFGMVTNLTLMEIASTSTPAMRELSRTAPGTFQHSMQVANISEDIVSEIGGNPLLARVGALYHDIGKMRAPLYFTENQSGDFNPHDELPYEESADIITKHVPDGIDLARKYHLPSVVTDFIRTHHGTTYTGYFYTKYKQTHHDQPFDNTPFRYAGPTPFSTETAIVMLVDSVEAACKSLKTHDKESMDRLIDNIIDGKIKQKQLNNCNLTFADITRIRQMLKEKLPSIYHVRISYPEMKSEQ